MTTVQIAVYDPETRALIWSSPECVPDAAGKLTVPLAGMPAGLVYVATRPDGNMLPAVIPHPLPEGAQHAIFRTGS